MLHPRFSWNDHFDFIANKTGTRQCIRAPFGTTVPKTWDGLHRSVTFIVSQMWKGRAQMSRDQLAQHII